MTQLWGGETEKAIRNFPISGEPVPVQVVRMLARVKAEAARVNAGLGLLDAGLAERVAAAAPAQPRRLGLALRSHARVVEARATRGLAASSGRPRRAACSGWLRSGRGVDLGARSKA